MNGHPIDSIARSNERKNVRRVPPVKCRGENSARRESRYHKPPSMAARLTQSDGAAADEAVSAFDGAQFGRAGDRASQA